MYHGTNAAFDTVRVPGIMWFTTSEDDALDYESTRLLEVKLHIENPANVDRADIRSLLRSAGLDLDLYELTARGHEVRALLEPLGYDGLVVRRRDRPDDDNGDEAMHYAIFRPKQVLSMEG